MCIKNKVFLYKIDAFFPILVINIEIMATLTGPMKERTMKSGITFWRNFMKYHCSIKLLIEAENIKLFVAKAAFNNLEAKYQ